MPKHCTTFMVDGYEVRATFAESRNAAVTDFAGILRRQYACGRRHPCGSARRMVS